MSGREDRGLPRLVSVRVPAKINLFLSVRGRRPDGYHELVTVLETVDIHDTVTAQLLGDRVAFHHPAARRQADLLCVHDGGAEVPTDERNLAVRAAHLLAAEVGVGEISLRTSPGTDPGRPLIRLTIEKGIPAAAGLAGGSADAAATLIALDRLWGCDLRREELLRIGARLGADVPFCLHGGTGIATGTGTATAQVLSRGSYHWTVAFDHGGLATAEVYAAWDAVGAVTGLEPDAVLQALRTRDPVALGAALHNDLEVAAFHLRPDLRDRKEALLAAGALGAVLSGSGPTVVGLASDPVHAHALAGAVADRCERTEVVRSPAGGPELVAEQHEP